MWRKTLPAVLLLLSSCLAPTRAWNGPDVPQNQLSYFNGYSTQCNGSILISEFDGEFSGTRLSAPAGEHRMKISFVSSPYLDGEASFQGCVRNTHYHINFESKAGHHYRFYVSQDPAAGYELTVMESVEGDSPEARPLMDSIEPESSRQVCNVSGYYQDCPGIIP